MSKLLCYLGPCVALTSTDVDLDALSEFRIIKRLDEEGILSRGNLIFGHAGREKTWGADKSVESIAFLIILRAYKEHDPDSKLLCLGNPVFQIASRDIPAKNRF